MGNRDSGGQLHPTYQQQQQQPATYTQSAVPGISYRDDLIARMMGAYFVHLLERRNREAEKLATAIAPDIYSLRAAIRDDVKVAHMIADEVIEERKTTWVP